MFRLGWRGQGAWSLKAEAVSPSCRAICTLTPKF